MRRAAYTNDISKPPIMLRVLGSIVKWALIALLAGLVAATAYFVVRGYTLYNNAAQEKSVADMVTDIESRAGFTPLEELPETYLAAVVSVEDHRFYQHPGFDAVVRCSTTCGQERSSKAARPSRSSWRKTNFSPRSKSWNERSRRCLWHLISSAPWTKTVFWSST